MRAAARRSAESSTCRCARNVCGLKFAGQTFAGSSAGVFASRPTSLTSCGVCLSRCTVPCRRFARPTTPRLDRSNIPSSIADHYRGPSHTRGVLAGPRSISLRRSVPTLQSAGVSLSLTLRQYAARIEPRAHSSRRHKILEALCMVLEANPGAQLHHARTSDRIGNFAEVG